MKLIGKFPKNPTMYIGSPEATDRIDPSLDQDEYLTFLRQVSLVVRVVPGEDDHNIEIAEKLAETGITENEALQIVISATARKVA